jgi:group I intron endonuclease
MKAEIYTKHKAEELAKTGVYAIINKTNNKFYIGSASKVGKYPSASGFYCRLTEHFSLLSNNLHHSKYLQRAWNKNGPENFKFKILEFTEPNLAVEVEQIYLDTCDWSLRYNMLPTADSSLGSKRSEESIRKMVEANQKTYKFLDKEGNLIEITNLVKYARESSLNHSNLWMLANGVIKSYLSLKCLSEVYEEAQSNLNKELKERKQKEWLYPNMTLIKKQNKIRYKIQKIIKNEPKVENTRTNRAEALEYALILHQILNKEV